MTGNPRNAMVWTTPYLQNEFGDPQFFSRFSSNLIIFYLQAKFFLKNLYAGSFWARTSLMVRVAYIERKLQLVSHTFFVYNIERGIFGQSKAFFFSHTLPFAESRWKFKGRLLIPGRALLISLIPALNWNTKWTSFCHFSL